MTQIYLISPNEIILDSFAADLKSILQADAVNNIAAFQLSIAMDKDNGIDENQIEAAITRLAPICRDNDVAFMICDNMQMVKKHQCDGLHLTLGCDVNLIKSARSYLGNDALIGASILPSKHMAMVIAEGGLDYIAIDMARDIKPNFDNMAGLEIIDPVELLGWWGDVMEMPCVAMGEIKTDSYKNIIEIGVNYLAISGNPISPCQTLANIAIFNSIIQ